jgi:hypothetical protein
VPETVYRYDRDPLWADTRRGIALMSGKGQLLVSMAGDNLSIVRCKPTHLETYNCIMAFGSDSSIYAKKIVHTIDMAMNPNLSIRSRMETMTSVLTRMAALYVGAGLTMDPGIPI